MEKRESKRKWHKIPQLATYLVRILSKNIDLNRLFVSYNLIYIYVLECTFKLDSLFGCWSIHCLENVPIQIILHLSTASLLHPSLLHELRWTLSTSCKSVQIVLGSIWSLPSTKCNQLLSSTSLHVNLWHIDGICCTLSRVDKTSSRISSCGFYATNWTARLYNRNVDLLLDALSLHCVWAEHQSG